MTVKSYTLRYTTNGHGHSLDITDGVARVISEHNLSNGIVTVFTPSSTSALTTIEFEQGAVSDFQELFAELVPEDKTYRHNLRWHDGNGHSHARAALLGASITIPVIAGRLTLGVWQQIMFIDFDNKPRQRELICQLIGE